MSFSKLILTIEAYDRHGIHRLNGVKVVYVLLVLFTVNAFFYIPNPYFYFFYIPITTMSAEIMGNSIPEKYKLFIYATLGATFMIFLFNILKPYPLFFLLVAFLSSLALYFFALRGPASRLALVPIILSLAAYSLIYPDINADLYATFNNACTTLVSMTIILAALLLFPLHYYYQLWRRSLALLIQEILEYALLIQHHTDAQVPAVQGHTQFLIYFAHMIPRRLPFYTVLKINLLANQLHLISCVPQSAWKTLPADKLQLLTHNLRLLQHAIHHESPCPLLYNHSAQFSKLIHSWNYLCKKQ
jgi:hypothetical protein